MGDVSPISCVTRETGPQLQKSKRWSRSTASCAAKGQREGLKVVPKAIVVSRFSLSHCAPFIQSTALKNTHSTDTDTLYVSLGWSLGGVTYNYPAVSDPPCWPQWISTTIMGEKGIEVSSQSTQGLWVHGHSAVISISETWATAMGPSAAAGNTNCRFNLEAGWGLWKTGQREVWEKRRLLINSDLTIAKSSD